MKSVVETRTCDRCGKEMYKDTGAWIGAEVSIHSYSTESGAVLVTPRAIDLCPQCEVDLRNWLAKDRR